MENVIPLRALGSTGLMVSPIGLGLAALGRPAYINVGRSEDYSEGRTVAAMQRRCHEMLDAAWSLGIRYIDVARSYGFAETFLAHWLLSRNIPRASLCVGSKWGYTYVGSWQLHAPVHEKKDLSVSTLRRQMTESRERLGDWLRLYQIHSATLESRVLEDTAVLDELRRLRSTGIAIGVTVTGPAQADTIRRALDVAVDGLHLFQVVQATWNLLEPSAGRALEDAKARGLGVIVKEAVANGRLTERNKERQVATLQRYAAEHRTTTDVIALGAAMAQPWADVVLSGAVTLAQLRSNVDALAFTCAWRDLPDVTESPAGYWSRRGALAWA
jgi:aryl-alcohol dehydrogenase-like predicted oxidoreductase